MIDVNCMVAVEQENTNDLIAAIISFDRILVFVAPAASETALRRDASTKDRLTLIIHADRWLVRDGCRASLKILIFGCGCDSDPAGGPGGRGFHGSLG